MQEAGNSPTSGASDPAQVTVAIVHFRAPEWCSAAVQSVLESKDINVRVVVVDNSGDLPELPDDVHVIRPDSNVGYAGGANLALRNWLNSAEDYCFVAAHDLTVANDTLSLLVAAADANPSFGIIAPWFTPRVARVDDMGDVGPITEFSWVSGSGYLLRRSMLQEIRLFDEDFGSYCEDRELCMRARLNGWRVGVVRDAAASSRGSVNYSTAQVMMHGNQILLQFKYRKYREAAGLLAHEAISIPRECLNALSPRRSTRDALKRSWRHLKTIYMASAKVLRWRVRGGVDGDPLTEFRRPRLRSVRETLP